MLNTKLTWQVLINQRPILRFFAPQGRHVAPMEWYLARRRGPIGATIRV